MKKVFRLWFGWNIERFENYLEEKAARGLIAKEYSWALTVVGFEKDSPKKIRYCVDYMNKPKDEYYSLFEDDGWNREAESSGYVIWSKEYETVRPDIYTDRTSLVERNQRLIRTLGFLIMIQIPMWLTNVKGMSFRGAGIAKTAYVLIYAFLFYGLVRIILVNKRMREKE